MRERVLKLGPERNLLSVVTPAAGTSAGVGVIFLNAGVLHRVGPHRLHVKLARHAAARGFTAVRFDLSGIGDSPAPANAAPHGEQAVRDTRAVMDELARGWDIGRFALFGICSGAEKAYLTAIADERVAGVFLMDGFAYRTLKGRLLHLATRLGNATPAKLVRKLGSAFSHSATDRLRSDAAEGVLRPPPRERFAADMRRLVGRGARVTLTYSANSVVRYAHEMHDAFAGAGFMERVVCRYLPDMNHIVTLVAAQQRLLGLIDEWLDALADPDALTRPAFR